MTHHFLRRGGGGGGRAKQTKTFGGYETKIEHFHCINICARFTHSRQASLPALPDISSK